MPWLRTGDNAATHPIVMRVFALAGQDDRTVNEVFGFVMRCALQSAGHTTDYVIDEGTVHMLGGAQTERLLDIATKAGYLQAERRTRGVIGRRWRLVDDPDFIHMRLRAEIEWERQRKADNANPVLTAAVRHRDGDGCRYCGQVVNWKARKGRLAGTYDHRVPGKEGTVETLVVACGACNSGRRDDPDADARYPLLPPPERPLYGELTVEFLVGRGYDVTGGATTSAPGSADSADPVPAKSGFAGSGRDGTGRSGSGRDNAGTGHAPATLPTPAPDEPPPDEPLPDPPQLDEPPPGAQPADLPAVDLPPPDTPTPGARASPKPARSRSQRPRTRKGRR